MDATPPLDAGPDVPKRSRFALPDRDLLAAPLRDASRAERAVRLVLAVLVVGFVVLATVEHVNRPREVRGFERTEYAELLAHAAEGRLERVDVRADGRVFWRTRNGAVFEAYRDLLDDDPGTFRAQVEVQPYVREHPGSVTYGPISESRITKSTAAEGVVAVGWIVVVVTLVRGTHPRRATRWAWFWIVGTGIGAAAYLLLSGSWYRALPPAPGEPDEPRRRRWMIGGVVAFVAVMLLRIGWNAAVDEWYEDRHELVRSDRVVLPDRTPEPG